MPSPIAHSISGYVVYKLWPKKGSLAFSRKTSNLWLLYAVFVSNVPDLDLIFQLFSEDKVHRGFTHSITATLVIGLCTGLLGFIFWKSCWKQLLLLTLIVYSLHLGLDAVTFGGAGMKLLWPLSEHYYRFPFSLFPPVHHSRGFIDLSHLVFLTYEFAYTVLLLLGLRKWKFSRKRVYWKDHS